MAKSRSSKSGLKASRPGRLAGEVPTGRPSPEAISAFLRTDGFRWLKVPNVVGVSVTEKKRGGEATGELAVVFDVTAKLESRPDIVRAGSRPFPQTIEIDGYRLVTDVVEAWPRAHGSGPQRKARVDPVCGGISVGNKGETGTLGAIVWHAPTGQPAGLSNWHVLVNRGSNDLTVQPGPKDDGALEHNPLGRVLGQALDDTLDAAVTSLEHRGIDGNIAGLAVAVTAAARASERMRVVKSGRVTGVTYGVVTLHEKLVSIFYTGVAEEHGLSVFVIGPDADRPSQGPLSSEGDSGSCWMLVDESGAATGTMVGLHVAGDGDDVAYACQADRVFSRLQLEPLGGHDVSAPAVLPFGAPGAGSSASRPYRVIARDGLVLRSGPDVSFPRLGARLFGQSVNVLGTKGDWFMVDLEGDGKADGFMLGAFLEPA